MINLIVFIIAIAGLFINFLAMYKSLKILKFNQQVYTRKLDVKLYAEPINIRFFYVLLLMHIVVWLYSGWVLDLDAISQFSKKLIWLNGSWLLYLFASFSIYYFCFCGKYWRDPIKNHSKITFGAFGVTMSLALSMSVHYVVYLVEVKVF